MKQLILNADDFGMTRGVNEGIIRAHRDGVLTSATLMANGAEFDDAVSRAKSNPKLGVGCHLVLVGGPAIAPREKISSLADANGNLPESLAGLVARLSSGFIRMKAIERELRAQIEKIRSAGIEPTHLDTHKHTHAHPKVMEAVGRVAKELGITRIRKPMENLRDSWETTRHENPGRTKELIAAAAARAVTPWFQAIARKYGLLSPDHFLGLAMTGGLGPAALRRMIDTLSDGSTEIMLHPGICDIDLANSGSRLQDQRETELQGLLDSGVRNALDERDIRLISYRELH
ncbi:MAG: ChbG/HpnK family deacetylase [Candidatus Acidiferrales bacterium]|jgi:hopanoid biosynthesis associated protein HpnK